ncbi:hypothetical protein EYF80_038082 [Liparis tanakae]|uniref:Uncharacterized protein n=1 Tax=Liparis tanakae TaxID=230148 RepID=A0A4Z2GGE0_9TELE|nr:hypothetical protein EYF80_038082 [Liparis tanakae]
MNTFQWFLFPLKERKQLPKDQLSTCLCSSVALVLHIHRVIRGKSFGFMGDLTQSTDGTREPLQRAPDNGHQTCFPIERIGVFAPAVICMQTSGATRTQSRERARGHVHASEWAEIGPARITRLSVRGAAVSAAERIPAACDKHVTSTTAPEIMSGIMAADSGMTRRRQSGERNLEPLRTGSRHAGRRLGSSPRPLRSHEAAEAVGRVVDIGSFQFMADGFSGTITSWSCKKRSKKAVHRVSVQVTPSL